MHEMALAESVREMITETARRNGACRVAVVRLEIGKLAQVEVDAMRFAFDVVMRGSPAESARLEIVETDGSAWCMRCAKPVAIARRGGACPSCDSHQLQVTGGERMRVLEIEVE